MTKCKVCNKPMRMGRIKKKWFCTNNIYNWHKCLSETRPRLTLEEYLKNENINYHTENALLLVKQYGTKKELEEMIKIFNNHMERGHILSEEQKERYELSNKYYQNLVKESVNLTNV